jgi:hypothetical protein
MKTTRSLARAAAALPGRASDRLLTTSERVTSAEEGRALLASQGSTEAAADQVQRALVLAVPVLRMVAKGARFTKVPWVLVGSAAVTTGLTVRTGVREVQVLGALLAHRIEQATGQPANPVLVKKLAVDLYAAPKEPPDLSNRRLRLGRLLRRWVFRGVIGRETGKAATKALEAAERLEMRPLAERWAELADPSSPPAQPRRVPTRGRTPGSS